jgi:hypothetical protein
MTEQQVDPETKLMALLIASGAIILIVISTYCLVGHFKSNNTKIEIETNKIAACTESDDVVGCLKALQGR